MKLIKKLFKTLDRLVSNRTIKWIIIPCLLLLLWLSLSLTYSSYKSFTVLQYNHNRDNNDIFPIGKILKNQRIIGEFTGKENNLGIVSVRLGIDIHNLENADRLLFHIREKGRNRWYYETVYDSGFFNRLDYSPFGFPPLGDSKGKIYEFEIISLNGNAYNALEIKATNPIYLSKYKFSKSEVFRNWDSVMKFMVNKILTFYTDYDTLVSSSVFLLPFVFYLTWMIIVDKMVKHNNVSFNLWSGKKIAIGVLNRELFAFLILTLIFSDIIFFENLITGFMLGLLGFWIFAIYLNSFKSKVTFMIAFIIIFLSVFNIYFNWKISVDKASTFVFMFIIMGFLQSLLEYKTTYIRNKK